jgi:hypothetical protein
MESLRTLRVTVPGSRLRSDGYSSAMYVFGPVWIGGMRRKAAGPSTDIKSWYLHQHARSIDLAHQCRYPTVGPPQHQPAPFGHMWTWSHSPKIPRQWYAQLRQVAGHSCLTVCRSCLKVTHVKKNTTDVRSVVSVMFNGVSPLCVGNAGARAVTVSAKHDPAA